MRFKRINWLGYSVFLFLLLAVLAYLLRSNDPAMQGLERYLYSDHEIIDYIGDLKGYQILNSRYVSETEESNRYHEYKLKLRGETKSINVKVRANYVKENDKWQYSIIHTYDLSD